MTQPVRTARDERGQVMVEFVLVIPVLLLMLFTIIQFGLVFGKRLDLQSATREGSRKASIVFDHAGPVAETKAAVLAAVSLTDDADVTVTVTPSPSPQWNHGDLVTVRTSTPWSFNVLGAVVWSGTLRAEAQARVE